MNYFGIIEFIKNNVANLSADFVGFNLNINLFFYILTSIIFTILLFSLFYLVGFRLRLLIKENNFKELNFFINIAIGYIFYSTAIALLGFLSILNINTLVLTTAFIIFIFLILIFKVKKSAFRDITYLINSIKRIESPKWFNITIFIYILLAFLNTLPPETGVDAILYHLSYPKLFIENGSIMLEPINKHPLMAVPLLGQMMYIISEIFNIPIVSRFLHFAFFGLVVMLIATVLSSFKNKKGLILGVLLFLTTPIIFNHASTAYVDFQWVLLWILSFWIITRKTSSSNIFLSALFFGGVIAIKNHGAIFLPAFILYILFLEKKNISGGLRKTTLFILVSLIIPSFWFLRAFILTGNPIHPIFSSNTSDISSINVFADFTSLDEILFKLHFIYNFSPILLVGLIFILYYFIAKKIKIAISRDILLMFLIGITYIFLSAQYFLGRYILYFYIIFIVILSPTLSYIYFRNSLFKYLTIILSFTLIFYYSLGTILVLPYGLGFANQQNYLSRILAKDNSSYFDFDKKFAKYFKSDDLIATYNLWGMYYADFKTVDVIDLTRESNDLDELRKNNITKLLIKGGDDVWFCQKTRLKNCNNFELVASYKPANQYLYLIK